MIKLVLNILSGLVKFLDYWISTAEERKERRDINDFESALVDSDEYTINRLLNELHEEAGVPADISTEG